MPQQQNTARLNSCDCTGVIPLGKVHKILSSRGHTATNSRYKACLKRVRRNYARYAKARALSTTGLARTVHGLRWCLRLKARLRLCLGSMFVRGIAHRAAHNGRRGQRPAAIPRTEGPPHDVADDRRLCHRVALWAVGAARNVAHDGRRRDWAAAVRAV